MDDATALWLVSTLLSAMVAYLGLITLVYFQVANIIGERVQNVETRRSAHKKLTLIMFVCWTSATISVLSSVYGMISFRTDWAIWLSLTTACIPIVVFTAYIIILMSNVFIASSSRKPEPRK